MRVTIQRCNGKEVGSFEMGGKRTLLKEGAGMRQRYELGMRKVNLSWRAWALSTYNCHV